MSRRDLLSPSPAKSGNATLSYWVSFWSVFILATLLARFLSMPEPPWFLRPYIQGPWSEAKR